MWHYAINLFPNIMKTTGVPYMDTLTHLAECMQTLFTTTADTLAKATGFVKRASKCNGSHFARMLVLGFLAKPDSTLHELCQTGLRGDLEISPQGLDQRFKQETAYFMQALLEKATNLLIQGDAVLIPVLQRFSQVTVTDSSTITLPPSLKEIWVGCGIGQAAKEGRVEANAGLKVHLKIDLCRGGVVALELGNAREHDGKAAIVQAVRPVGSLSLSDLAYFNLPELKSAENYVLWRFKAGTKLYDEGGRCWEMSEWLNNQATNKVDCWVELGKKERVRGRVLAARVPQKVADERRRKMKKEAKREGKKVSAERLALASWQVYVTNVPERLLSLLEGLSLGRARWQIELVFKCWKSQGKIDEWRSGKPWAILCEIYAKLLACLIKHWVVISSNWEYPDRSMYKAGQVVMQAGRELAGAINDLNQLLALLKIIERGLIKGCKLNKRKAKPNNYQILLDSNLGYFEFIDEDIDFNVTILA
jgi:hypothetical protein